MKILSNNHKHLNLYLKAVSNWIGEETLKIIPKEEPKDFLYNLILDYPLRGGKKFRPALIFLCCELFGGDPEDALISAISLELFHNFALIHDDIEDNSELRRGAPTLHLKHGIPLAINSGDALFCLVHDNLLKNHHRLNKDLAIKIHKHLNKIMMFTFEGQALDIGWIENQIFPKKNEYKKMIIKKTGYYSGRGPCQCGALIAGASKEDFKNIGIFGEAIGIGFQIRDDLLNLTEKSEYNPPSAGSGGYGKEQGGDILEGKRTLITIELLERLNKNNADMLRKILLKPREDVSDEDIKWVINKANSSGAIKAVVNYCLNQADIALNALKKLPEHPAKFFLEQLVNYLTLDRKA